jgi:rhamnulokinase
MSHRQIYIAVDLGASSGRVIGGIYSDGKLSLEEVHRFPNGPTEIDGHLYWKFEELWQHIVEGLKQASEKYGRENILSIGVDTWGVDYGLLDAEGTLLHAPYHYRDSRLDPMLEKAFAIVPKTEIFGYTGIQFLQINTLYQVLEESDRMAEAHTLLMAPDLINYRLTGKKVCERTNASTTQFYNPTTHDWAFELLERLGIRKDILPELIDPGEKLGELLPEVAAATGLEGVPVFTVASHDTGSAVAAVPAADDDFAYLSSGTWSLLGVELTEPRLSTECQRYNFTNEIGVGKTIRLLKNVNGLWILQECRRIWHEQGKPNDFSELVALAEQAPSLQAIFDPDNPAFTGVCDMPAAVQNYCRETNQPVPQDKGAIVRTVIDSLAMKTRYVLEAVEKIQGSGRIGTLHIIGGGTQNKLLNQSISDAINRPVITGPVEATAAGNVLVQMMATGSLSDLRAGRALIRNSFDVETYTPSNTADWDAAYERFASLYA